DLSARCPGANAPADPGRAREGENAHAWTADEHVSDVGSPARQYAQPAGGQARLGREHRETQRGDRSLARGLVDDGASGREGGGELVGNEVEREVEGRDRTDDADRHAHRPGRMTVARLGTTNGHRLAGETTRLASRERIRVDGARRLDARGLERLAGLGADRARQLVGPIVKESGDAFEDL